MGLAQPPADVGWACRESRAEEAFVRASPPPIDRRLNEHEYAGHGLRAPAEPLAHDLGRQADLLVQLSQRAFGGQQLRLHLDHDEVTSFGGPAEDIERSALSIFRVGHLGPNRPTEPLEPLGHDSPESSVVLVDQSVRLAAAPSDFEAHIRI
jgi:hypothetical protein